MIKDEREVFQIMSYGYPKCQMQVCSDRRRSVD